MPDRQTIFGVVVFLIACLAGFCVGASTAPHSEPFRLPVEATP